ncbi:MAG: hypothetical protein HOP12_01105 [Candidatus Eisenbacteria bacterium]|uniref:T9SS type A sorting domain-containing protein n=1 Tax=Eiseniibacteriota bacterium TaxID=2212470 RepID=A0A849SLG2_UNCEI|nr:hypothetical protein [Candidatus Eisenbacteria bacterium]
MHRKVLLLPSAFLFLAASVLSSRLAAAAWPTDPTVNVALCTAGGNQLNSRMTTDGAGGAIVTWVDNRVAGNSNIYAHHVRSDGTLDPAWPAKGLTVCLASGAQTFPAIASDGAGGAIAVWRDARGVSGDVYAQRVHGDGQIGDAVAVAPRGASQLALLPVRPNPVRGSSFGVDLTLDGTGIATLDLIDAAGRRVASRELGSLAAGSHHVTLGQGLRLRPGIYCVQLRQGGQVRVASVSVLR